jgi:hypothetical protein
MPFVNSAQRRACYAQAAREKKEGLVPKWDCHKFANEIVMDGRRRKIHKGPRGGKYVIVLGVKKYLKK